MRNLRDFYKDNKYGNRKSESQNNICKRNKITEKKTQSLNKYIKEYL